ncbi:Putative zinc metalloprotease Lmo1318 [Geodia barretti]|uniref:Zinc metalloprotease Lmo1318 n=1 Tax=Geodia barretti TaxID=519541 RepID=A0AA35SWY9_GEOBA|nr:Putative zinc metalloprotease Lmo1318 [Geodia barretti]
MGHFLTAKWFGITVKEFGFGFPPRLVGIRFSPGGTIYSINWIPLGGFVRMVGEHGEGIEEGRYVRQKPEKSVILVRGRHNHPDFYGLFAVPRDASQEDIRRSYVELVELINLREPDRRDRMLHTLQIAYSELSNPERRAAYDELIKDVEMGPADPPDHYGLLDVPLKASQEEIDEGYEELKELINNKNPDNRAVLCAGSVVNLIFPVIVFAVLFALPHDVPSGKVVITAVAPGSPAELAGVTSGDTVIAVNGNELDTHGDLVQEVMSSLGSPTELTLQRGVFITGNPAPQPTSGGHETVTLVPRVKPPKLEVVERVTDPAREVSLTDARRYQPDLQVGDTLTQGAMGVMLGTFETRMVQRDYSVFRAIPMSFQQMWDVLTLTRTSLVRWASGGPDPGLSGPVGIARVTGQVAQVGLSPLLQLTAIISISLGIVNLLPIPALDGGRLMFVIIEFLRGGKPISPRREGMAHLVGFLVLIGLIVVVSYFDIIRLINGDSVIP